MEHKQSIKGLNDQEVIASRAKYGANTLTPPKKVSLWRIFLTKFEDPIIIILLVAIAASFGVSCFHYWGEDAGLIVFLEPLGIAIAALLATAIGFLFEHNANKKFEMLNQVNDEISVKVIRNDIVCEVVKRDIVVGDIVLLNAGDEVPADGELSEAVSLQLNESTLTGEPIVSKTTNHSNFDKEATYPSNMVYRGTTVVDGHGIFKVTSVGDATEYGKVYEGSRIDIHAETPLSKQLKSLADLIAKVSYFIAALLIITRIILFITEHPVFDWVTFGSYIVNTVMIAVTVVVVSVPEGLPMSVTLSLALSMRRMLLTNNLVRQMHACETMGAVTVICTDKTGTLTQNQMQVYELNLYGDTTGRLVDNELSNALIENISINSTAFLDFTDTTKIKALGNPTEAALLLWLNEQRVNYLPIREEADVVDQLTFSTERKYMGTLVNSTRLGHRVLYVKGAPEIVYGLCSQVYTADGLVATNAFKNELDKQLHTYQNQAMRTLGFAYKIIEQEDPVFADGKVLLSDLIFMGVAAISDPVRADVPSAVEACINAGINIKIVTGDTSATAIEIGRQIGLWTNSDNERNHITGTELAEMSEEQLLQRVMDLKVISRARPMDKKRLVETLQKKQQVVAVTGDGTNDAPALKTAQVGLSMGDGTQVAKEASAITILDNSFNSITRAVMWGRSLYQNIQRFIVFQMTINVAACLIVLISSFLGEDSPLSVTQMLWVNIIMDTFAALALASLPPSERVMDDKPRKYNAHIITKKMAAFILGVGITFVVFLLGLVQYFKRVDITSLTDFSFKDYFESFVDFSGQSNELTSYELSLFFTIFVMLQFWNMFNAKAYGTRKSTFRDFRSVLKGFGVIAILIVVGQILIVQFGGVMFNVVPISVVDWFLIISSTSVVLWIGELFRIFKR